TVSEVQELVNTMRHLDDKYAVDLIGGDTVSGSELTFSITVFGKVRKDKARYRSAARPGDIVFVTGTLGDSQAGFHILTNNQQSESNSYFIKKHRMPTPQIEFANALGGINRLSLNDISDGLANEAREIAEASKVTINLLDEAIPTS